MGRTLLKGFLFLRTHEVFFSTMAGIVHVQHEPMLVKEENELGYFWKIINNGLG